MKSNPRASGSRRFKPLYWGLGGTALVVVAGLGIGESMGWSFLRKPLERAITTALHTPAVITEPFRAHLLWRPSLQVGQLQLGPQGDKDAEGTQASAESAAGPWLDIDALRLEWRWRDLARWRWAHAPLRLRALHMDRLDAHLMRTADGKANWTPERTTEQAKDNTPATLPVIDSLRIRGGLIDYRDEVLNTTLHVVLQGSEGSAEKRKTGGDEGGYEIGITGRVRALPLSLRATLSSAVAVFQDGERTGAVPAAFHVEGRAGAAQVDLNGSVTSVSSGGSLDAELRIRGESLGTLGAPLSVTLPTTPPFDLDGQIAYHDGVWRFVPRHANAGHSRLSGDFTFDTRPTPPLLTGRLTGSRLALADLGPTIGTPTSLTPPSSRPVDRRLPTHEFDLPSLHAMNARVQVNIDELDLGTSLLAPLRNLQGRVELQDGTLHLNALKAVVAGGTFSGHTSLATRDDAAHWATELRFAHMDMAAWLGSANRPAAARPRSQATSSAARLQRERAEARSAPTGQPVQAYVTGALDGEVKLTGQGRSTAEILGSLDGQVRLNLSEGTLSHLATEVAGLDLAQLIGVGLRGDESLPLHCAKVEMNVRHGVATPRYAVIDNADSTLRVTGQVDLAHEKLALVTSVHPKDFSPMSLRTPLIISGTFAAPKVTLERGRLAGKLLAATVLSAISGPVGLLALADPGDREQRDPCSEPNRPLDNLPSPAAGPASSPSPPKRDANEHS